MLIHSSVPPISRVTSNYSPIVASQPFLQKVELSLSSEDPLNSNGYRWPSRGIYIYIYRWRCALGRYNRARPPPPIHPLDFQPSFKTLAPTPPTLPTRSIFPFPRNKGCQRNVCEPAAPKPLRPVFRRRPPLHPPFHLGDRT